ncbi:MAG: oxygenase MpaB family protein, partial [Planctomycetota bacterium]|nr:oxygenase MpaB family protein [Planctomycetota bacterium]
KEIDALDVKEDAVTILDILMTRVFPIDVLVSLEMAQIRTFSIPSISALLHKTRQYEDHGERRLDDTKAILTEMTIDGLDSQKGQSMVEHLNRIHGFYDIPNDDYLYTLSTFIFDPILWIKRYGWRDFTAKEKEAIYNFFASMGEAMKIKDIPTSLDDFWQWRLKYEAAAQKFAPSNKDVTFGLINAARPQVPFFLRPFVPKVMAVFFDDPILNKILGLPKAGLLSRVLVNGAMKARAIISRWITPWDKIEFRSTKIYNSYPTYPNGYKLSELGPSYLTAKMKKADADAEAREAPKADSENALQDH